MGSQFPCCLKLRHEYLTCRPVVHPDIHKVLLNTSYRSIGDFASLHYTFQSTSTEGQVYSMSWEKCLIMGLQSVLVSSDPLQQNFKVLENHKNLPTCCLLLLVLLPISIIFYNFARDRLLKTKNPHITPTNHQFSD